MASNRSWWASGHWTTAPAYQRHQETLTAGLGPGHSDHFSFQVYDELSEDLVEIRGPYVDRREYDLFIESHMASHDADVTLMVAVDVFEAICWTCRGGVRLRASDAAKGEVRK